MIKATAAVCVFSFALFLWKSLSKKSHPLFDLTVLKDRNFAVACTIMLCLGLGMYGAQLLLPMFLENSLGFPSMEAGLYLMPRGIFAFISMSLVGKFSNSISPRKLVLTGMLLSFAGAIQMTQLSPQAAGSIILLPLAFQGLGMGLIFAPMSTLAFASIPRHLAPEAAGLYSLMRSIGSSIGISIASTWLSYSTRANWSDLRGSITPYNPLVRDYLSNLHMQLDEKGIQMIAQLVQQQATIKAYVSSFYLIAASFILMLPLLLLIKPMLHKDDHGDDHQHMAMAE